MTVAQRRKLDRLSREAVAAYKAWMACPPGPRCDRLGRKWVKAADAANNYNPD